MVSDTPLNVMITGASGNLGNKIRRHLDNRSCLELTLLDCDTKGDAAIIQADFGRYDDTWACRLQGIDVVVHLAGEPRQNAPWQAIKTSHIDAAINIYEAAAAHQCKRVIFASSNATMTGYLEQNCRIESSMPGLPVNFYGACKAIGESLGRHYSERHGLSVICLRLGWTAPGDNQPDPDRHSIKLQQRWLSNRDFCQGIEKAIHAEDVDYAVLNLMSANTGMPWDLKETGRVLDYKPGDGITPTAPYKPPFYKRLKKRFLNKQHDSEL